MWRPRPSVGSGWGGGCLNGTPLGACLAPGQMEGLQQAASEPPLFLALGPAQIGLGTPAPCSPSKGQEAGSPLLSDETSARGSLSLMKGSLCGAGRPLAKDKTAVCPPSLARGWGLPLDWLAGWGWAQVRSLLPFSIFPASVPGAAQPAWGPCQSCPQCGVSSPSERGAPGLGQSAVGREAVSSPALEAYKQMLGQGPAWKGASTHGASVPGGRGVGPPGDRGCGGPGEVMPEPVASEPRRCHETLCLGVWHMH